MLLNRLQFLLIPALLGTCLGLSGAACADSSTLHQAYGVLHSRGLLAAKAQTPARNTPAVQTVAPPVTRTEIGQPLPTSDEALSETVVMAGAYQILQRFGLLPADKTASILPSRQSRTSPVDRVVVDKSERKLYLLKDGRSIREYSVWLGRRPKGAKRKAGDLRTPEGVYTLDWRNPNSRYHKSIHVSYPNALDQKWAAERGVDPGGMIMIHGEHNVPAFQRLYRRANKADWTDGCIALRNEQMDEIWNIVPDGTPIEIRP